MRLYAVLADIHGNYSALSAVAAEAQAIAAAEEGSLSFICLGDVVDYGPQPNECVAWVTANATTAVLGNHDLLAINDHVPIGVQRNLWPMLLWTRAALTPTTRAAMAAWQPEQRIPPFQIFHSSLTESDGYINTLVAANETLGRLKDPYGLFGHTHIQCSYFEAWPLPRLGLPGLVGETLAHAEQVPLSEWQPLPSDGTRVLLNPGSVGQPRRHPLLTVQGSRIDYRASYLLIRESAPSHWDYRFQRTPYDLAITVKLLGELEWVEEDEVQVSEQHPLLRQIAETKSAMRSLLPVTVQYLIAQLDC